MIFKLNETLLEQMSDAFWSLPSENHKNLCQSRPQFPRSRLSIDFFVILEGVLPVVGGKVKNETVATFYDVCGVFGSKNDQFSLLRSD